MTPTDHRPPLEPAGQWSRTERVILWGSVSAALLVVFAVLAAAVLTGCGGGGSTDDLRSEIEAAWPTPWLTDDETAAHVDDFVEVCEGDRDALSNSRLVASFSEGGREMVETIITAACPERLADVAP